MKMGDIAPDCLEIVCGVPQGSVLRPVLFNLYINGISKVSNVLKFVLFADNTNILVSGKNVPQKSVK